MDRYVAGLPPRYRDSVRQITPGLPLFLYNYSTHQLHGIFEVLLVPPAPGIFNLEIGSVDII